MPNAVENPIRIRLTLFTSVKSLQNRTFICLHAMSLPIDSNRSALPPLAKFLAEAASQRQSALLGLDKPSASPTPLPTVTDPSAPPPTATSPSLPGGSLPTPADKASISPQAAGFDPRGDGRLRAATPALPGGALAAAAPSGSTTTTGASALASAAWPATGLGAPLLRMVSALVAQVTAQAGAPQRVVAAQPQPAAGAAVGHVRDRGLPLRLSGGVCAAILPGPARGFATRARGAGAAGLTHISKRAKKKPLTLDHGS